MDDGNAPYFLELEQRSDEWLKLRLGKPTASNFHRIVSAKGKYAGKRKEATSLTYKWHLLAERIFGVPFGAKIDHLYAVRHGVQHEAPAREALEDLLHLKIKPGGIVMTRDKRLVASPDGWVGENPVEIKCPQIPRQLMNLLANPRDYWPQLQGHMLIAQTDWLHFWSWHPCTPARHIRVLRDNAFCDALNYELRRFCDELDEAERELRAIGEYDIEMFLEMIKPNGEEDEEDEEDTA